jgi:putative Mg2+ transporter-C (MgtC) family protein
MIEELRSAFIEAFPRDSFNILPHLITLAAAYGLAFPIGWHRERTERSAGLRTFPLVALAACAFVQAAEGVADTPEALASVVEGIITGMGFIGGGAILRMKVSVKGTATAASLWATGAVGIAVGLGTLDVAIMISAFTLVTLWFLSSKAEPDDVSDDQSRDGPDEN